MFGANTVMPAAASTWCCGLNTGRSCASGPPCRLSIAGGRAGASAAATTGSVTPLGPPGRRGFAGYSQPDSGNPSCASNWTSSRAHQVAPLAARAQAGRRQRLPRTPGDVQAPQLPRLCGPSTDSTTQRPSRAMATPPTPRRPAGRGSGSASPVRGVEQLDLAAAVDVPAEHQRRPGGVGVGELELGVRPRGERSGGDAPSRRVEADGQQLAPRPAGVGDQVGDPGEVVVRPAAAGAAARRRWTRSPGRAAAGGRRRRRGRRAGRTARRGCRRAAARTGRRRSGRAS